MNSKNILTIVGFLMAGIGILSLILSMMGVQITFMVWLDGFGKMVGFVLRLLLILGGSILIYVTRTDFEGNEYLT